MDKKQNYQIITERIDDIVLLLNVMKQMGLPELINDYLPRHPNQQGLDWGWVGVIWLSYILSQGDHRKVTVREWVNQRRYTIEKVCGIELVETDFTDDRLTILLRKLSHSATWSQIERGLNTNTISIYDLSVEQIRLDATTMSGHHLVSESGLFQFGHSKDDPSLAQIKVMLASLDPLGMPLATTVVSGEQADDGLYRPIFKQVSQNLGRSGLLWVGDCKMSSIETRGLIHSQQHYYLAPLSRVGKVPGLINQWVNKALGGAMTGREIIRVNSEGQSRRIATAYELSRLQQISFGQEELSWTERVLLVHSQVYQQQQQRGLEQRLKTATEKILALTPSPGRGKRQIRDELTLHQKVQAILKVHRVEGLLDFDYEYHPPNPPRQGRYQIKAIIPDEPAIEEVQLLFGWRAYVTNAPIEKLSLHQAVLTYRDEWLVERNFGRLKGVPLSITPFFVQRDDQVKGLVHLLSLAARLLSLIEFVVRRRLQQTGESLKGLYPGNPTRATARPTTEKLLKAFDNLTLTLIQARGEWSGDVTPLSPLQSQILTFLGLSPEIYSGLVENST